MKHFPGCPGGSALSWVTGDGCHLWGRNFDFNRLAEGTAVTYVPAGTAYAVCGSSLTGDVAAKSRRRARYAAVGMGLLQIPSSPILYEGVNDQGLMGGQLYYRYFAHYGTGGPRDGCPIQPPFVVYHLLAQCATVVEAAEELERHLTLVPRPLLGMVPYLHWAFSDRTGEMLIVEPDEDGLHLYRHTLGVMTNSPGYPWHRTNLLNYAGIRDLDREGLVFGDEHLAQCFSGSGAQGLPGDWSAPSRFVRLAFLRKYAVRGADETEGVARMLRLMQSAAFPLGMVRMCQMGQPTPLDGAAVPFAYTVYTAVCCAESGRYYWTTYENQRVRYVALAQLRRLDRPRQFPLERAADLLCVGEQM